MCLACDLSELTQPQCKLLINLTPCLPDVVLSYAPDFQCLLASACARLHGLQLTQELQLILTGSTMIRA